MVDSFKISKLGNWSTLHKWVVAVRHSDVKKDITVPYRKAVDHFELNFKH